MVGGISVDKVIADELTCIMKRRAINHYQFDFEGELTELPLPLLRDGAFEFLRLLREKDKDFNCNDPSFKEFAASVEEGFEQFRAAQGNNGNKHISEFKNFIALRRDIQNNGWEERAPELKTLPDLVGLAISGGGIRSATFSLGVLQWLNNIGLFSKFDYLSTVSGGGYIGSAISSWFSSSETKFPFKHEHGKAEDIVFQHLRNYARYLAPHGLLDSLKLPGMFVRGALLGLMVIFPTIMLLTILANLVNEVAVVWFVELVKLKTGFDLIESVGRYFLVTTMILILSVLISALILLIGVIKDRKVDNDLKYTRRDSVYGLYGIGVLVLGSTILLDLQYIINDTLLVIKERDISAWLLSAGAALFPILGFLKGVGGDKVGRTKIISKFILVAISVIMLITQWVFASYVLAGSWNGFNTLMSIGGICLAVLGVASLISGNLGSIHPFYRDKLARAYLIKKDRDRIVTNTGLLLSNIGVNDKKINGSWPYHLVNGAVNLTSSSQPSAIAMRGRNADPFMFSKKYIGSRITGYCETKKMEEWWSGLNLATAMAVSGAAFSPNMGQQTKFGLRSIMTMLNLRLGYWLPNPGHYEDKSWLSMKVNWMPLTSAMYREMFGMFSDESVMANVSDGGHIENLGIYELVARRCRLIVVIDAEEDVGWHNSPFEVCCGDERHEKDRNGRYYFEGLANAIRLIRTDMGITIEMNNHMMQEIETGKGYCAVGTIYYTDDCRLQLDSANKPFYAKGKGTSDNRVPDGKGNSDPCQNEKDDSKRCTEAETPLEGKLIYIKSNYLKDESRYAQYLRSYRTINQDFPHETTGDQFFDETQFECYRALGYQAAKESLPL